MKRFTTRQFLHWKNCNVSNCQRNFYQTREILTWKSYNALTVEMKTFQCFTKCRKLCNRETLLCFRSTPSKMLIFLNWINWSCQILMWKNYNVSDFELKNMQRVTFWNFELISLQHVRWPLKNFTTTRFWRKLCFQGVPFRLLSLHRSDRFCIFCAVLKSTILNFNDNNLSEFEKGIFQRDSFWI